MIKDLQIFTLDSFKDHRGSYTEIYTSRRVSFPTFVEDDVAVSHYGVLRGFHGDHKTWKLIYCPYGKMLSVILDCRKDSPTFKQWDMFEIGPHTNTQILVPPGCGNSVVSLADNSVYIYKQSEYYSGKQFTVKWNDPELKIPWPITDPILSIRDIDAPDFDRVFMV